MWLNFEFGAVRRDSRVPVRWLKVPVRQDVATDATVQDHQSPEENNTNCYIKKKTTAFEICQGSKFLS